jgi:hypothetical protein
MLKDKDEEVPMELKNKYETYTHLVIPIILMLFNHYSAF